jgi:PAS domain S-box-containing protein
MLSTSFASKEVLLLHSYHKGYKWSDDISKAIEDQFQKHPEVELTTIYMDTKRVAGPTYLDKLAKLYKEQFAKRNFDLIIVSDNNAFEFAIRYHDYLFKNLPVLFTGINNFDKALLGENNMNKYTSGVVEQVDLEKNFQLISKLHPNLKKLLILNDQSKTGYAVKRDLNPIIEKYREHFDIEYIDNMDIENIQQKVTELNRQNSAVLFVLLFKDKTGKHFTYKQSFQKIRAVSQVPIYGLWDFYLDYGMLGGLLTSAKAQGQAVSKMAIKVLQGTHITHIPILEKSPNRYIFDNNELLRFGIDVNEFLDEFEIINLPSSVYREYTKFFVLSIVTITILSILVLTMRANIQRRKKLEKDLSNQLKFEKVLLDTLPNAIYYKNKDGKFIGCNHAFCKLMNLDKRDIIGKTAFDFFPYEIAQRNTSVDERILKSYSNDTSEIAITLPNQHMKYFILNKAVYSNIDGSIGGIVCIMDDITERVQQKQFLIQQSKLAEMGDMVAAIAHQWNEPLVELSAQVQDIQTAAMLEELQEVNIEEFVQDSMVQIKYMSKTLTDFRNFLKPSTKKNSVFIEKLF